MSHPFTLGLGLFPVKYSPFSEGCAEASSFPHEAIQGSQAVSVELVNSCHIQGSKETIFLLPTSAGRTCCHRSLCQSSVSVMLWWLLAV